MLLLSLLMAGCKEDEKVVELTPVSVSSVETEAATTQKSTKSPTEPTTATEEEVKISPRVQRKLKKMDIPEKVCKMFMAVPKRQHITMIRLHTLMIGIKSAMRNIQSEDISTLMQI
jgi:hypothetical protein